MRLEGRRSASIWEPWTRSIHSGSAPAFDVLGAACDSHARAGGPHREASCRCIVVGPMGSEEITFGVIEWRFASRRQAACRVGHALRALDGELARRLHRTSVIRRCGVTRHRSAQCCWRCRRSHGTGTEPQPCPSWRAVRSRRHGRATRTVDPARSRGASARGSCAAARSR
jgi:hypothetical protein